MSRKIVEIAGITAEDSNIDRVDIKGAEINLTGKVVDGWKVFGSFNVTDSEIKKNRSRPYTVGNKSPYTADWTLNLGSEITAPLTDTRPAAISVSASRREATPARAITLAMR